MFHEPDGGAPRRGRLPWKPVTGRAWHEPRILTVAGTDAMLFRQLFDHAASYTYLLGDEATCEAVLVDPMLEQAERDLEVVSQLGLTLVRILNTHVHADHVTAASVLRKRTGARTVAGRGAAERRIAGRGREEFIAVMKALNLPEPARPRKAVALNLACGRVPPLVQGCMKAGPHTEPG